MTPAKPRQFDDVQVDAAIAPEARARVVHAVSRARQPQVGPRAFAALSARYAQPAAHGVYRRGRHRSEVQGRAARKG